MGQMGLLQISKRFTSMSLLVCLSLMKEKFEDFEIMEFVPLKRSMALKLIVTREKADESSNNDDDDITLITIEKKAIKATTRDDKDDSSTTSSDNDLKLEESVNLCLMESFEENDATNDELICFMSVSRTDDNEIIERGENEDEDLRSWDMVMSFIMVGRDSFYSRDMAISSMGTRRESFNS
ncbi:unnamed protein product [Dovyalis caffra]|uniref:Uncharacterized protein n=1 Tax=Dovyalis caffra TaxID=77055 RepID=A0AAV1QSE4_9ROSI|nr:unnamed protein product [Dovyalis caffra]